MGYSRTTSFFGSIGTMLAKKSNVLELEEVRSIEEHNDDSQYRPKLSWHELTNHKSQQAFKDVGRCNRGKHSAVVSYDRAKSI